MKKNCDTRLLFSKRRKKLYAIMRIFAFIMLVLSMHLSATTYSQQTRMTLNLKNVKLNKVFNQIKAASDYGFFYNMKDLKKAGNVDVIVQNATIDQIMQKALRNSGLGYRIINNTVIVKPLTVKSNAPDKKNEIKGIVKDNKGKPIPGATIVIKGTKVGVSTDIKGEFTIKGDKNDIVVVSFIGMKTKEVKYLGKKLTVVLEEDTQEIGEIVCTGYQTTTVKRATGSVAVIKKEELENKATPVIDEILQGKIAGVQITKTSGRPGATAKIRIRGTNTITGNAEPLWVVDGVPLQKSVPIVKSLAVKSGDFSSIFLNGIAGINANDIENITILKDASAAAIYGSRAAGGVIVITTKRGKAGKMNISYSANMSLVLKPQRDGNLMNTTEKIAWEKKLWDEFSEEKHQKYLVDKAKRSWTKRKYPVLGLVGMVRAGLDQFGEMTVEEREAYIDKASETNTDWFDELFRNSLTHNHHLSISGGNEKTTYYVSMGYSENDGLVKNTDYTRYNVNTNITNRFSDKVTMNFSISASQQESNSFSGNVNPYKYAYYANPYEKLYNEDGSYAPDNTYFNFKKNNGGYLSAVPANGYNILREINETSAKSENTSITINSSLRWDITKDLSFNGVAAYSYTANNTSNINGKDSYAAFNDRLSFDSNNDDRLYGSLMETNGKNKSYTLRAQFNYRKQINENNRISIIGGAEVREQKTNSFYQKRYGYDPVTGLSAIPVPRRNPNSDQIDYNDLKSYADLVDRLFGSGEAKHRYASYYTAFDYDFKNKYLLSFTVRADGSDSFGSDEQFNHNWSLGLAWHVDREPFMESVSDVISSLSFRAATGYTGNTNKSVSPYLIMTYADEFRNTENNTYRMGDIDSAPNDKLRWEKTRDAKLSMNLGLFDGRINLSSEVYYRLSKDLVTNVKVPSSTGYRTQGFNTSEMENKGFELSLRTVNIKTKNFSWSTSINFAKNVNELTKYNSPTSFISGGLHVGYPLGSIYSGKLIGIDPKTGYYKFKLRPDVRIRKKDDLTVDENYLYYVGTSEAPISGGFSNSIRYKNLSLSFSGNYSFGNKMFDDLSTPGNYGNIKGSSNGNVQTRFNDVYQHHYNQNKKYRNVWTKENPITDGYPVLIDDVSGPDNRFRYTNPMSPKITKIATLEKMWFIRIKSINLSYSLPKSVLNKFRLSSCSLSCGMSNPFTFTDYSGIDPESSGAVYPITRTFTFGVNIGF